MKEDQSISMSFKSFVDIYLTFWCRGYYVDTVGKNAKKIQEYIQNQLQNDLEYD
ncbi:transposase [Anaerostipes hadrus]|uniref:transposase n=1 Tax=Anaerostipes hadrus TaxID=649756 RepID=UPI003A845A7E